MLHLSFNDGIQYDTVTKLRHAILCDVTQYHTQTLSYNKPINIDSKNQSSICNNYTSIRGRIWQALLYKGDASISCDQYSNEYIQLSHQGKHHVKYEKIRVDSARTFPRDMEYNNKVDNKSLIRVLNAFTHKHTTQTTTNSTFTYIQGMNTLAATFLYVLCEIDSYHMLNTLLCDNIPLYYQSSHIGVHAACTLIDLIIQECDSELYDKLLVVNNLQAYIYAFSPVSSLGTSVLPLNTAVEIWDWLFAAQCPALNVVCVAAQVLLIRHKLLNTSQPKSLLDYRVWPQLNSVDILQQSNTIISTLNQNNPALLYDIVHHATDNHIAHKHAQRHHTV